MRSTFTAGFQKFLPVNKASRYLLRLIPVFFIFFIPAKTNAQWWNLAQNTDANAASGYFYANFDVNTGKIHVESFLYNSIYNHWNSGTYPGWLEWATLYYVIDGTEYPFYVLNVDAQGNITNNRSFGPTITDYSTKFVYKYSNREPAVVGMFDLHLTTNILRISKIVIRFHFLQQWNYGHTVEEDATNRSDSKDVSVIQMSSINTPSYKFFPKLESGKYVPKVEIGYSKNQLNEVDNRSEMHLYATDNGYLPLAVILLNNSNNTGSAVTDVANTQKDYYYQQNAYAQRWKLNSPIITVPAFTLPFSPKASYNPTEQKATFSWKMTPVSSSNVVVDNFKLQIADNRDFNNAQEKSIGYVKSESDYKYEVTSNLSPKMYFRIARNSPNFDWQIAAIDSVSVSFSALADVSPVVLEDKKAILRWNPAATAWIPGASFIIKRINNTTNNENEIKLGKADFDKGRYEDERITVCNSYSYTLQVIPPSNSDFVGFPAIEVPGSVLPTEIGTVKDLQVSKGYFPDRVELRWSSKGTFDNFLVKRAVYGTTNFVQIATVPGNISTSEYQTDDAKGAPGVYYSYQVIGAVKCNNASIFSKDTLNGIGFRSPTGNIYGRITYENGQAVEDVTVQLKSNDVLQQATSVYLNGSADSYLKLDSTTIPFADSAFTLETWIKPDNKNPVSQVVFSRKNQYELGFNSNGQLYFSYKNATVTGPPGEINGYVHVAGIYNKGTLTLMSDTNVIGNLVVEHSISTPEKLIFIGKNASGNLFEGHIDEMRLFNIAIPVGQLIKNQSRILSGNEHGLVAYWRFDETITEEFYDLSYHGDIFNRNDGKMNGLAVTRSNKVPTAEQLSLKAFTDSSGNYSITGIPYLNNGTTYTIIPRKGTHQFDPASVNRLLSQASPQFTVDFKDKSSFPLSGAVYYNNSTVPVSGVQFKIDGQYAQHSNGDIIETDDKGLFTISVPVGYHEVKAVKANHVFKKGGKLTDANGNNYNYQQPFSGAEFSDSTTIRFIGRIAGGTLQAALPLGHSVSVNNLGKELSVSLNFPTTQYYRMRRGMNDSIVRMDHLLPANSPAETNVHKTFVTYKENSIEITPDPITGEFVADIIPIRFSAKATATGWIDELNKNVPLDFSNEFVPLGSGRKWIDSALNNDGIYIKKEYFDSITYNASYKFIARVEPTVEVYQKGFDGKAVPYFGNLKFQSNTLAGKQLEVLVADTTKRGLSVYPFNYPVFEKGQVFDLGIKAFEQYPFYEQVLQDGRKIKKVVDGHEVQENVPTSDGFVSINNYLRDGTTTPDTLSLNENGAGSYQFTVGDPSPDPTSKGLKDISVSVLFGEALTKNWNWNGKQKMSAYVMGGRLSGNDFVTSGPDKVLMILRDPPGSKSYSYIEKGFTISSSSTYTGAFASEGDVELVNQIGAELITFSGLGVGTINTGGATTSRTFGFSHAENYKNTNSKETTTTITNKFQTSDDPLFVGPIADVFVGYSTNIIFGSSDNVTIIEKQEVQAKDVTLADFGEYLVVKRTGINIGEKFGTMFAYPQQHIEKILIPNLITLRNALLHPTSFMSEAQAYADANNKIVYVSKQDPADTTRFGKSNRNKVFGEQANIADYYDGASYKIFFPRNTSHNEDSVNILNQSIDAWEARMAENERNKIDAIKKENYSFHAGSPVSHTESSSIKTNREEEYSFIVSSAFATENDVKIKQNGFELKVKAKVGTEQVKGNSTSIDSTSVMGFSLASNGTDDYFTMDLMKARDSSFVFHTKGGASGCPYVGATVSKYYQPGYVIDQPTARIEVPVLKVDKPVAVDVPSSRKAVFNLTLSNDSEAKLPATFIIGYSDTPSVKGAILAIDGTVIGGSGRAVYLQYGQSITKVLTLTKGPEANDYENIQILLHSACQYDPTSYQDKIADTVLISAHFIPSCSDINIKSPTDKWVLNSKSDSIGQGKHYLPITINNFDVNNSLFHHIELQYKPASTSNWQPIMNFYTADKFDAAGGLKQAITNPEGINYNFVMDNAYFSDQLYDIRAVSYCKVGERDVTTESNLISGIKDTYKPRLFGTPQPANGVLNIADEVRLNFNEPIAGGLLNQSDFKVTGIRNGSKGDHSVSVKLDGKSNYLATDFEKSFTGKNITAEMWVLPTLNRTINQTIFSHGDAFESMELALTTKNELQITIGQQIVTSNPYTSIAEYKAGEWAHIAIVYNDNAHTVSAFYNYVAIINAVTVNAYTGTGHIEYGHSVSAKGGYFAGEMHEARIWNDTLSKEKLQLNSLTMLSGTENTLLAYYPMNEGKGETVFDKAHGSHAALNGLWSTPRSNAVKLSGGYMKMNTAAATILAEMDYTIELWFKADASNANASLASNGKGDGTDYGGSFKFFNLGFEAGVLTFRNNGFKVQATENYLDNKWHHVAVTVNRNAGSGQLLIDGLLNQYFSADELGSIDAANTYLGARVHFDASAPTDAVFDQQLTGFVDEFRIWNAFLNETLLAKNNNTRLQGTELGLLAYYPMDKDITEQGIVQRYFSLDDAKIQTQAGFKVPTAVLFDAVATTDAAPIKNRGPIENLKFDFVVNTDALILNVQEPKQYIDKSVITFAADNIYDLNGNKIASPVIWSAYVDQNQLKWSDKEIELVKEANLPMTFESHLVNSGGTAQRFAISNLPSWLKASVENGTVDPKGDVKILFTINEALNIGSYEEIIFMRNDNNETEALKVTLQVKGKKPNWVVDASKFQYSMGVYGKIRVNNIFSKNKEDMLAAFINGECVGVTYNTYNSASDFWYTVLTVFNNDIKNANIEFRIWQASTGKTFQATPSKAVLFANNTVAGTPAIPVIFDATTLTFKDMVVNQNWNWVSFNLQIPLNTTTSTTLMNGVWTEEDVIKDDIKSFSTYKLNDGWTGSLKTLTNLSLYKLKAANAQSLTVSGIPVNVLTTYIPLKGAQWNYISYLPQLNATLKEALAGYQADEEDIIKSQTGFAMYSKRSGWIGSLNYLEPGKGYMLFRKRASDVTFRYPVINGSLSGRGVSPQAYPNTRERPVTGNYTNANNMTIIATVSSDFELRFGDSIVAYVNGEVRAKVKPVFNPEINGNTYFFNVGGETEQPLVFTIERNGNTVAQSTTIINYRANTNIGTLGKPLQLQFVKEPDLITVYPNPFNANTSISLTLKSETALAKHQVQWSVLDVSGKTIMTAPLQTVSGNGFRTTWNGRNQAGNTCTRGTYLIRIMIDGVPYIQKVVKQ